ncbi:MAG: hypothetical protein SVW57_11910, partial [Thermodesulfobacteriota bacterium]|nr:hypothetical protein [Thermodesulfobacteriota bacterium]
LNNTGVHLSQILKYIVPAIDETLAIYESSGLVSTIEEDDDENEDIDSKVFSIDDEKRLQLEYYKNNIIHFFVPVSIVSLSLLASNEKAITLNHIKEDYSFIKDMFSFEFIYNDEDDAQTIQQIIDFFLEKDFLNELDEEENGYRMTGKGWRILPAFRGLLASYLESYWIVIKALKILQKEKQTEKQLYNKFAKLGLKLLKMGEIHRAESLSKGNYQNAVKYLISKKVLKERSEKIGDKDAKTELYFYLGKEANAKEYIRNRLFKFINI